MLKILKPGLWTSIQDQGRFGFRNEGVPVSGAMDLEAAAFANSLLGNAENEAVLEITLMGPVIEFSDEHTIALTGADLSPKVNGEAVELNIPIEIKRDDTLSFGKRISGARCYLAVLGGLESPTVLGSKSYSKGICVAERFTDSIDISPKASTNNEVVTPTKKIQNEGIELTVFPGPEFDLLNDTQRKQLEGPFTIGLNNRMAYQLNEKIANDFADMLSGFVMPGTVQLTPSGKLIVLMRDCQTTGGYPRILQLTEEAINQLAQKIQGETITFNLPVS